MSAKLGKLVKEARTAKGLTQAALADKVDGLTSTDVGKIERGEKEPSQTVLRKMAAPLGLTQKALLDAATGAAKTSSAKTSTGRKTASKTGSEDELKLTATEKKLVRLYRQADSADKKAAMGILSGETNLLEIAGALFSGKAGKTGSSSASGKDKELLEGLMQSFLKK